MDERLNEVVAFQNVAVVPMDSPDVLEGYTVVVQDAPLEDVGAVRQPVAVMAHGAWIPSGE